MISSINCAECDSRACVRGGAFPEGCPSVAMQEAVCRGVDKMASDVFACKVMAAASASIRRNAVQIIGFVMVMMLPAEWLNICSNVPGVLKM